MRHLKKLTHLFIFISLLLCLTGCGALFGVQVDEGNRIQETAQAAREARETEAEDGEEPESLITQESESSAPDQELESDDEIADPEVDGTQSSEETEAEDTTEDLLPEDGSYTSKEDVALYLYQYGHLPSNFITKKEAEKLGWEGGSLEPYAPGMCIGGSHFGNYEGLLPEKEGRSYTECDIDTLGADQRGAKRIVFSNDGLIYYTEDHYESFELLYGEES